LITKLDIQCGIGMQTVSDIKNDKVNYMVFQFMNSAKNAEWSFVTKMNKEGTS